MAQAPVQTALEPLRDRTGRFTAQSAVLRRYRLWPGITLTTEASMKTIATFLGIAPRKLSEAWLAAEMTHHPARPEQPPSTKNIAVWQVLALMEMGLLDKPE